MTKKILVTGASGFVGQHLIPWLEQHGHDAIGASRHPGPNTRLLSITGANTDWRIALDNIDVVVHLAGIAHRRHVTATDHQHISVGGCESLIAALRHAPKLKKIIFVSTAKIWGETSGSLADGPWRDSSPPNPPDAYAAAKRQAETVLQQQNQVPVIVLRPPLIYGTGVKGNFGQLLRLCQRGLPLGLPLPLGSIDNRRNFLDVLTLCSAIETIIQNPITDHRCYGLADQAAFSTPGLISHLTAAMAGRLSIVPCPTQLLWLGAKITGKTGLAERLIGNFWLEPTGFRHDFNWQPPRDPFTALTDTAHLFRE
jgi:UDP-glucose 4-epimerase